MDHQADAHHAGLSYAKITNFLWDYFHLQTVASTFVRAGQRLAKRAEPTFELLKFQLRLEHVVHADETGWRIGILPDWLWAFSSQQITIYQVGGGRGHDVPLEILGDDFSGILISDGLASYDPLPYLKGRCLGHILARISKLEAEIPVEGARDVEVADPDPDVREPSHERLHSHGSPFVVA